MLPTPKRLSVETSIEADLCEQRRKVVLMPIFLYPSHIALIHPLSN